ncbi:MAG: hypothetical protein C5B52_01935 [Bacteroidetes bacterium]|nr:MAG: hypothetical protein C5B52_01935 [Bacteroidota bacterium]
MNRFLILILLVPGIFSQAQQKPITANSKIEKVTIFLKGAQITRSSDVSLPLGKSEIIFSEVSPKIEQQSIQVKANDAVTILAVSVQQNFLKEQQVRENIKSLETDKENLNDKIIITRSTLNIYKQEETLILKNQDIKGTTTTLKASELKDAADFQRQRLTEIYAKEFELDKSIKKMENDLSKINNQLYALNQQTNLATGEIAVTVMTKSSLNSHFTLDYMVNNAGWQPAYDIRVKDISSPLTIQQKAKVYQQSGEDWKEVKLSLSTGTPDKNATQPMLSPWFLGYKIPYSGIRVRGAASSAALEEVVVTGYGTRSDDAEPAPMTSKKETSLSQNAVQTNTTFQPTTVTYEIELPYTVMNDGKTYSVDIIEFNLKADYEYFAVPKLQQEAFLTAKITNWQDLNLLDGNANLFFEGTYLGTSYLDAQNAGDTMKISLGKDKGVIVKRVLQKDFSQKKFLGSTKSDTRQYEITIRNNKQQDISIRIEDQFPIPNTKEIEIGKLSYGNGNLDDTTQKVSWLVSLTSKKEEKLPFGFTIKYPKDKIVVLD